MNNSSSALNGAEPEEDLEHYHAFLAHSRFWVQRVLVPVLLVLGLLGNGATVAVMTRRRMRSSTHRYLAALASFDTAYLVMTFLLSLKHYETMADQRVYWTMMPVMLMLADTCSNTSVWLTVTFTVERYIAVCYPMRGKVLCTESRAKKAIACVFFCCLAFTTPTPFEWVVAEREGGGLYLDHSSLGSDPVYKSVYYWLTVVLFIFVPIVLLAIFNSFLIRSVHVSKQQRSSLTRAGAEDSSQETKITVMLIAVVILFFFCQLPTACHLLYTSLAPTHMSKREVLLLTGLGNIFNFLVSLNCAGNFVLYCLLSHRYRRTFALLFCPCAARRQAALLLSATTVCSTADSPRTAASAADHRSSAFLQVPRASRVVYEDDDDSETSQRGSCVACKKLIVAPWRHIKESMGAKKTRETIIPLKGGGNKCIVITAPEGMPNTSQWTPSSAV